LQNIKNNELIQIKIKDEFNQYSALIKNNKNKNKNIYDKLLLYENHTNVISELELLLCDPPNVSKFHLKYNLYDCFTPEAIHIATANSPIGPQPGSSPICDLIEIEKTPYSSMSDKRAAIDIIKKLTGYIMQDSPDFGFNDPSCFIDSSEPEYVFIIFEKMYSINMNKLKKKIVVCMEQQV
jgi:hypothetical protein